MRAPPLHADAAVRSRIIPLASLYPGASRDDLARWGTTLDGVRVVGLGEATHGSRELFTLKHRLLEYLALERNLTVVALEAGADGCRELDSWLGTGRGDPARALQDLGYWTWNTEEVLAMLRWMRVHNARLPAQRRVRIVGVDPTDRRRRRSASRDQAMAQAVLDLVGDRDQARVAFWAHNGHVSAGRVTGRVPAAGSHLRAELGAAYHPLALTVRQGAYQALRPTLRGLRGPEEFSVPEPPADSVEHTLGELAAGDYLFDLRNAAAVPALRDWAGSKQAMRTYGSIALGRHQRAPVVPGRDFDAVVLVRRTSRARPLPPRA